MPGSTPETARRRLLQRLLSHGFILAGHDHRTLTDLLFRRHVQVHAVIDVRGNPLPARVWSISDRGRAWLLRGQEPGGEVAR